MEAARTFISKLYRQWERYVGAGGLGILIDERIGWRDYNGLGTVLLTLFVAVFIIENLSQFLRSKLS